jgi:hypothetical protein
VKQRSALGWRKAQDLVRDASHRVEQALPGGTDHDGR